MIQFSLDHSVAVVVPEVSYSGGTWGQLYSQQSGVVFCFPWKPTPSASLSLITFEVPQISKVPKSFQKYQVPSKTNSTMQYLRLESSLKHPHHTCWWSASPRGWRAQATCANLTSAAWLAFCTDFSEIDLTLVTFEKNWGELTTFVKLPSHLARV